MFINTKTNATPDPYKVALPEFDYSIFRKDKKIGTEPAEVLEAIGLKNGDTVADFGAGAGFYTITAAKIVSSSGRVFSIDADQKILEHLKQKVVESGLKNIYGILTNLEKENATGLKDGEVDIVLMINLLYLIKDKELVLREAHRILKLGGKLVVMDWTEKGDLTMLEKEEAIKGKEVKDLAIKIGFRKLQTFEAGISHEVNVFIKKA